MTSTFMPSTEVAVAIINMLRADPVLSDPTTGMLFGTSWPQRDVEDFRVWTDQPDLSTDTASRDVMPSVFIEATQYPVDREQASTTLEGDVNIYVHTVAPRQFQELAERIDAHIAVKFVSTQLSGERIIAAALVPTGLRRVTRNAARDDAWEVITQYRSSSVGVLV